MIGFAIGAALAGCASTGGARSETVTNAEAVPNSPHEHGEGGGMMAAACPMQVSGTTVASTDVEGGTGLAFTTASGDVGDLRRRVRQMAGMHNSQHTGGMMKGRGMKMPAATASVDDIDGGARLILRPHDPAQLAALQEHARMKAQRMAGGECPMMSPGNGKKPAGPHTPGDAAHDPE